MVPAAVAPAALDLERLSPEERRELLALLEEQDLRESRRTFFRYYPDTGPLRREKYPKHLEAFAAGARYRQRGVLGGNRSGKTDLLLFELTCHLTGIYPAWWHGRRFKRPIKAWLAGTTWQKVREILQEKLLGPASARGTGMVPGDLLGKTTPAQGVPEAVGSAYVKHATGGWSEVVFKTYEMTRTGFEGTAIDFIGLDEEPDLAIYTECLLRTMTCDGIMLSTFTPLAGMSEVVMHFLDDGDWTRQGDRGGGRWVILIEWDDAPHLTAEQKAELEAGMPAHQRDARRRGIPQLGAGAIYPIPETDVVVKPFPLPEFWPSGYGLDVGWERTAAAFFRRDPGAGTYYLVDEYYRGQSEPAVHAAAILSRGRWQRGAIDPAARGRNQVDGKALLDLYGPSGLGLNLVEADNAVDAGIGMVFELLSTGRLKVFETCLNWRAEFRLYRRDEKGRIVKKLDHLMDATRYFCMSGRTAMVLKPTPGPRDRGSSSVIAGRR